MTSEIERYQDAAPLPAVDSWVTVVAQVGDLASKIANTEFVPESLRGKTAAVAAAILAGREMNVPPMTALSSIHVIKGKPSQSAELMRMLVLAHGHQIRYVETTDTRCVVEGRRRGEDDWQRVAFTADQAKKAKINLGDYPEDKLIARATSRLCRRVFADVLGGMAYSTEELEDGADADTGTGTVPPAPSNDGAPAKRTAKRKTPVKRTAKRAASEQPEQAPDPGPEPDFGDEEPVQPTGHDEPITPDQLTKLQAIFTEHDLAERDTRLRICSQLVERDLSSANDLTKAEAITLIDALENLASTGRLPEVVEELLNPPASGADEHAEDMAEIEAEQASDQGDEPGLWNNEGGQQ